MNTITTTLFQPYKPDLVSQEIEIDATFLFNLHGYKIYEADYYFWCGKRQRFKSDKAWKTYAYAVDTNNNCVQLCRLGDAREVYIDKIKNTSKEQLDTFISQQLNRSHWHEYYLAKDLENERRDAEREEKRLKEAQQRQDNIDEAYLDACDDLSKTDGKIDLVDIMKAIHAKTKDKRLVRYFSYLRNLPYIVLKSSALDSYGIFYNSEIKPKTIKEAYALCKEITEVK